MMDDDGILERERRQMELIRELDMEELQVEEVGDDDDDLSSDDELQRSMSMRNDGGAGSSGGFTYNTCLTSLHTYLGPVDYIHCRFSFLDGGAVLNLPMFYLEGVVLFPEATLPLRVIQPRFIASLEKAFNSVDVPCTIGVVRVCWHPNGGKFQFSSTGTTAEIRQFKRLGDGSFNVVARGQQRFHLRRHWVDDEGAPCGEVQIIREDSPLKTPNDAFGKLASISNSRGSDISITDMRADLSGTDSGDSPNECGKSDESSSDDDRLMRRQDVKSKRPLPEVYCSLGQSSKHKTGPINESSPVGELGSSKRCKSILVPNNRISAFRAPMTSWPLWVYKMYDSHSLAQRAADLWGKIVGKPSLDEYMNKPDLLSFYIASKLPMSEAIRQELLEIDGISYRLQREIQLLKGFNLIRCRNCQTLIAKRSDMVAMSSDGPLNAYVNPYGFVHETITVQNATGLALFGSAVKDHSWFPGYAWTIANCGVCESNIGWLFTATKKNLLPKSFWGIRSSKVADDTPK